jgi:hypothetical protein
MYAASIVVRLSSVQETCLNRISKCSGIDNSGQYRLH